VAVAALASGRYRFVVAVLLFAAGMLNYIDRAALGVAAPAVERDLGLSPSQLGLVFSTFFVGYALCAFLGGQLADRYGPLRVYSWAAGSWSLLCALTGVATGFVQVFVIRSLFGVAEGPMSSTTNRMITNWFPREETSRAIGFTFSGQTVGSTVAAPVVGLLTVAYGWRVAFLVTGGVGLIWVFVWRRFATDLPRENGRVGEAEIQLIAASRSTARIDAAGSLPLRAYLVRSSTLSLGLGLFAVNYAVYIFLSWLPSYLTSSFHMSMKHMSFAAAIPWACGFVGYVGGGIVSDAAYRRLSSRLAARKLTAVVPLAGAAVALAAVTFASTATAAVAAISIAVLLLTCSVQSCWATIHELVPERHVGGVGGFAHFLGNIAGVVGPAATGFAVQYFGGYSSAFVVAAGLAICAAVAMTLLIKRPIMLVEPLLAGSRQRPT
jgi:ACS family hexuronate transporter-like MFS transporter